MQDPWWNPAVEEQAIMRIHRIGQTKGVKIKRFIVKVCTVHFYFVCEILTHESTLSALFFRIAFNATCVLGFDMVGVTGIRGRKDAGGASKKATNDCWGT